MYIPRTHYMKIVILYVTRPPNYGFVTLIYFLTVSLAIGLCVLYYQTSILTGHHNRMDFAYKRPRISCLSRDFNDFFTCSTRKKIVATRLLINTIIFFKLNLKKTLLSKAISRQVKANLTKLNPDRKELRFGCPYQLFCKILVEIGVFNFKNFCLLASTNLTGQTS